MDIEAFNRKMEKLIRDCHETIRQGGHVALLIQNTTELGGDLAPTGRAYVDHVFDGYGFFLQAGFAPLQRINVPLSLGSSSPASTSRRPGRGSGCWGW